MRLGQVPLFSVFCLLLLSCTPEKAVNDSTTNISETTTISESPLQIAEGNSRPDHPFKLTIRGSGLDVKIDTITATEFDENRVEVYHENKVNGDSLIVALAEQFRDVIILTDSCCVLKGEKNDIKVCRGKIGDDQRDWVSYRVTGYERGYLILMDEGYESWTYICFDPRTRTSAYSSDLPRFIDDDFFYSAGNYYAEGQFQITNIREGKSFGFDSFNWEMTGFYREGNSIFMKFESQREKRYLEVAF